MFAEYERKARRIMKKFSNSTAQALTCECAPISNNVYASETANKKYCAIS